MQKKLPEHLQKLIDDLNSNPEKREKFEAAISKPKNFTAQEIDCSELFG